MNHTTETFDRPMHDGDHRTLAQRERDVTRSRRRTAILADAHRKAERARRGRITDRHGVIDGY